MIISEFVWFVCPQTQISLLRKWKYGSTDHEKYRFMKWLRLYQVARIEMNETTSKRHLHNFPLPMEAAFIPLPFR